MAIAEGLNLVPRVLGTLAWRDANRHHSMAWHGYGVWHGAELDFLVNVKLILGKMAS